MATINPSIPLAGRSPDISGAVRGAKRANLLTSQNQLLEIGKPAAQAQADTQVDLEGLKQSVLIGEKLGQFIDSNDTQGAIGFLNEQRATRLEAGEDVGPIDSDIAAITRGDLTEIQQEVAQTRELGKRIGFTGATQTTSRPAAAIQEFEFLEGLTPDQQEVFKDLKRRGATEAGEITTAQELAKVAPDVTAGQVAQGAAVTGAETTARETAETAAIPAQVAATGTAERHQTNIELAQPAADSLAVIRRANQLLESVSTGGFAAASLAAKQAFGVEGADEAELSNNLGKAVLSQLRTTFGAAFTENEGRRLEGIEAGFGKSTEGNKRLLGQALKLVERVAQRGIDSAVAVKDFAAAQQIQEAIDFTLEPEQPQVIDFSELPQ